MRDFTPYIRRTHNSTERSNRYISMLLAEKGGGSYQWPQYMRSNGVGSGSTVLRRTHPTTMRYEVQ